MRWNPQANELFAQVVEIPPPERMAYLDAHCPDTELRRAVEELLAAHDAAGSSFLENPPKCPRYSSGTTTTGPTSVPALAAGADVCVPDTQVGEEISSQASRIQGDLPGHYQLDGEIARGGMGCILRGRDTRIGREVAVKVLLETHQGRTELAQRFVEEARIAGRLQHPGIVPVYDMGDGSGGRPPYFTMKLVRGQTLFQLLKGRASPSDELPRWVATFEQVCHAVAYAHSRGVIHRDLKPANIMVGAHGEVQVMDWGLAKVLSSLNVTQSEEATDSVLQLSGEGGTKTQVGSVLGTPAYMAPEQARGEIDTLDRRTDVFGLGAILCVILTGQPPFPGGNAEALRIAQKGDMREAFQRLDASGAEGELVALCKACLQEEPTVRPADAAAVAQAVTAYQRSVADRLRAAEAARAEAVVRATEERKRRKLAVALAASVVVTLLVGGGGLGWVTQQQAQREREQVAAELERAGKRQEVTELLGLAEAAGARSDADGLGRGRGHVQRALALLEAAPDESLQSRAEALLVDLEQRSYDRILLARLETARLKAAEVNTSMSRFAFERALPEYRKALQEYGWSIGSDDVQVLAARLARRPQALREAVVAALDDWVILAPRVKEPDLPWLKSLLETVDPSSFSAQVRAAAAQPPKEARAALESLAAEADVAALPPAALHQLIHRLQVVGAKASELALLRRGVAEHPGDFWLNHDLGGALAKADSDEAVRYLSAALALRPGSPGVLLNLGVALYNQNKLDQAIACYQKAIAFDSKYADAYNNLGIVLRSKERVDEAIACFQKAIEFDPRNANPYCNLGAIFCDLKADYEKAIAYFRQAIKLDPKDPLAHYNLGNALKKIGKADEAIPCYQKAIALDPNDASIHNNLGNALYGLKKLDEAVACLRRAIDLDPKFAEAYGGLGQNLLELGRYAEACKATATALRLLPDGHPLRATASAQMSHCERLLSAERKLPKVLDGSHAPTRASEYLDLAQVCEHKQLFAGAARFYFEAFSLRPDLAAELDGGHCYNAACDAARAGSGEGKDGASLSAMQRHGLRLQALTWLHADLNRYRVLAKHDNTQLRQVVAQSLTHWQQDSDLAGVREATALARLPATERAAWQSLWADVTATRQSASSKK